jgi:hypothetical protein
MFMKTTIKLTPEQFELLCTGNKIAKENEEYYQFPFWVKPVKDTNNPMTFELFTTAELPIEKNFKMTGLENQKYIIQKTNGKPVDADAFYFVLRLDEDPHARNAAKEYARSVEKDNILLATELLYKIKQYENG